MGAAQVEQLTLLPALCQYLKLFSKDRPVPEVVPARCYLVKDFFWVNNYLTPWVPLSFEGEGEEFLEEGLRPS